MEYRILGKTGLKVSVLGFGCGGVGGIMVGDDFTLITRCIERAVEAGVNYFDTAQLYGEGRSEENLRRVVRQIKPDIIIGTKTRLIGNDMEQITDSIIRSAETSLRRLGLEQLDLFQLHNPIRLKRNPEKGWIGIEDLEEAANAFRELQMVGKIRYWGINGIGDTEAVAQWVEKSGADTIQICFNLFNPTSNYPMPINYPFQDYDRMMKQASKKEMGIIAFRILAGGALSGSHERNPIAAQVVEPIASNAEYAADVDLAKNFQFLVSEGWAGSLPEAAIRFALNQTEISTIPIGFSSMDQLDQAIEAVEKGPLLDVALEYLPKIWQEIYHRE